MLLLASGSMTRWSQDGEYHAPHTDIYKDIVESKSRYRAECYWKYVGTMFDHVLVKPFHNFSGSTSAAAMIHMTLLVRPVAPRAAALRVVSVGNSSPELSARSMSQPLSYALQRPPATPWIIWTPWFEVGLEACPAGAHMPDAAWPRALGRRCAQKPASSQWPPVWHNNI
eukprot:s2934_g12.t1